MEQQTLDMFRTLTELPGVAGNEHQVRKFMKEQLSLYTNEIVQDNLGSIFGVKEERKMDQQLWLPDIWMRLVLWLQQSRITE